MKSTEETQHFASGQKSEGVTMSVSSESANWSYEATVAAIEATVARLEQGELPLAKVFDQFEQAVHQLQECEAFLQARQEQADLLIETLGESL